MRTLLCLLLIATTFNARAATYLLLSQTNGFAAGITNQAKAYTDAHSGGGFSGAVSNAIASAGLLAVDATKTNGIAATFAHVTNALGYAPVNKAGDTIVSLETSEMIISNATANSWAYLDAGKVLTNAPYTPANKAGEAFSGLVSAPSGAISSLLVGSMGIGPRSVLTETGGQILIDLSLTNRYWSCSATGNVAIVLTNCSVGNWGNLLIRWPSTNCLFTHNWCPAGSITNWISGAPSTNAVGGTIGFLGVYPQDNTTNSTICGYAATQ